MHLFTNLLLYMILALGVGFALRSIKAEDDTPRLKWYISGLIIGTVCAIVNAILVSGGTIGGNGFNLEIAAGSLVGGLGTGLFIGIPIGMVTAYDMSKRFIFVDGWMLLFKVLILFVVIGGTVSSLALPKYSGEQWFNFFVFGLAQGGIYALIALGYTLVYGILFMINFAHGEVFMSGAFTAFFVAQALAEPGANGQLSFLETNPLLSVLAILLTAMFTSTAVAVTLERVAYRPLRRAPRLVPLITAIGASFFLQYTFRGFYGSGVQAYPPVPALKGNLLIGDLMLAGAILLIILVSGAILRPLYGRLKTAIAGLTPATWGAPTVTVALVLGLLYLLTAPVQGILTTLVNSAFPVSAARMAEMSISSTAEVSTPISRIQFVVITASVLLMLGLYYIVNFTKIGKAMRAVSEDKDVAALMGINVDQVITATFVLGASLAGAAGVLYALIFRQVHFFMGFLPGLKAFTAAVLGGIGNIPGAMLGGLFLGVFESLGPSLFLEGLGIPAPYQLKDVIAFTMLVLVLIFRPSGIMGVEVGKKKA